MSHLRSQGGEWPFSQTSSSVQSCVRPSALQICISQDLKDHCYLIPQSFFMQTEETFCPKDKWSLQISACNQVMCLWVLLTVSIGIGNIPSQLLIKINLWNLVPFLSSSLVSSLPASTARVRRSPSTESFTLLFGIPGMSALTIYLSAFCKRGKKYGETRSKSWRRLSLQRQKEVCVCQLR